MEMELELEPRVKALTYKIKGTSRESPTQKSSHVLDTDLRTHWSTATNTKEWILLELDEPCLLSHIRIYNKSVLEWEIAVGLRYKPEAFVKVRPRCEAPRRDMMYPMTYTPCRYVRISCLRGNPIAIFFIQLIGVSITGLEPEFQPVVNHLLPHIVAHKQDAQNMHLQLLQDITKRLLVFLPQLEADLTCFSEAAESHIHFLAMIAGPLYPILHIVSERQIARASGNVPDADASRSTQVATLTVSSNFEALPRRSRSPSPFVQPAASSIVFHPDAVFILLRRAYTDSHFGIICRTASRVLEKLIDPGLSLEAPISYGDLTSSDSAETTKVEASNPILLADYSSLFGDEYRVPDDQWDSNYLNVLDVGAVEEGILHVLYACASQPILCRKLADNSAEFWSLLPLVQALLPALRPPVFPSNLVDNGFSHWQQPFVQQAVSQAITNLICNFHSTTFMLNLRANIRFLFQIVAASSSSVYCPLLHACAGYLSSFSPSHAKAACVLIDLCSGPLAPWISTVIAKVDLTIELLEELLGTIQEVKHKILFLVEMLEPFLDPAITIVKNTIAFGDVSTIFLEKQEQTCALALNVIRTAVKKPAVLPSLESEWRRGSVAPSVLLSILGPNMPLPPEIDHCKCHANEEVAIILTTSVLRHGRSSLKPNCQEEPDGKTEFSEAAVKVDLFEDAGLLFAPPELKSTPLRSRSNFFEGHSPDENSTQSNPIGVTTEGKYLVERDTPDESKNDLVLDVGFAVEYFNLQADFLQLINHRDCELRASEFQRLALELHLQADITPEGHDASIDAFLLAAECYVNPFFMMAFRDNPKAINQRNVCGTRIRQNFNIVELKKACGKKGTDLEVISHLERKRDVTVLQILLEAAELDREYHRRISCGDHCPYDTEGDDEGLQISVADKQTADAVTLVRQNQALLCRFLVHRLRREQHSMHEILMQSLLFLLHSGTELFCSPDHVIDIILGSAEYLNELLSSFYYQLKEGNLQLDPEKVYGVQRRWVLLQRLVIASCGGDEGPEFTINFQNRFPYKSLISPTSWMQKIPSFSSHSCALVRFLGWMAVSRYAKQYLKERVFLCSNLEELTRLLSIFADELALADVIVKEKIMQLRETDGQKVSQVKKDFELNDQSDGETYYHVIYPDLHKFFPNMKKQFDGFGEIILEAVGLQLKSLPSHALPDVLCWFSDLCLWPFSKKGKNQLCTGSTSYHLKGYAAKNAKAIILYVLEAIMVEHMEAMVPEIPRVVQVLLSLCRTSYCDVAFLESVLRLLKPLISYALRKISNDEKLLTDESSCLNFESLCFDELISILRCRDETLIDTSENLYSGALTIFILGAVFTDLSFRRRREILQSLTFWADFTTFEPASSFYDYLSAFLEILESCDFVLMQTLRDFGVPVAVQKPHISSISRTQGLDDNSQFYSCFLDVLCHDSSAKLSDQLEVTNHRVSLPNKECHAISAEEFDEFSKCLEDLVFKLNPTIDLCWKLHHQLTKKLTIVSSRCYMRSRCLSSVLQNVSTNSDAFTENISVTNSNVHNSIHWRSGLQGLAGAVMTLQENRCWEVASVMLDYLLGLPQCFCMDDMLGPICSAIKYFCSHAPRLSWRLQTDKWLSIIFTRGVGGHQEDADSLVDLFCMMLGHPEPEQRSIALQHLGRVVGHDANDEASKIPNRFLYKFVLTDLVFSVPETVLSLLVSRTWDRVVLLSSSDPSMFLRIHAMALLVNYIPFAERENLQSLLGAADSVLHGLGKFAYSVCESPLTKLSLTLLAAACLYSPAEDVTLIPQNVWNNLETLGMSHSGQLGDVEKKACAALCKLRTEEDDAKVVLKEALASTSASERGDTDFESTRESILQVLANLSTVQTYFDMFSKRIDIDDTEVEEAEIEMDILQKEQAMPELSGDFNEETQQLPILSRINQTKDHNHLQQIKDNIHALEKSRLREDIVARRQKKLLLRRARQKYLEEAALREAELLQEVDREKTSEVEREIERQRMLELERARTRELRYNLDMEKERQTQKGAQGGCVTKEDSCNVNWRELQRELELAESGLRSSRREFSSSTTNRSRDRFRERENGRSGQEGSLRPSSSDRESGASQPTTSSSTAPAGLPVSMPTVVLGGSRPYLGQLPTILQSRDRSHERGSSYEDNYEGSKDSGDTGSAGDPDLASAFDGLGSYGSSQRQGSRGSKSRQIMERRERDGRREGKWERKHS
ncbi:hypothetical protein IFM89_011523 [Coptis chinensis]|uniref:Uncharacterized protein n=1 Tax=Coptis chinensis TaxID=261450 RepID=A0A835IVA5_9MAGN|nr:hypothetical protein IFM89_011523 [Coptis chinensis]